MAADIEKSIECIADTYLLLYIGLTQNVKDKKYLPVIRNVAIIYVSQVFSRDPYCDISGFRFTKSIFIESLEYRNNIQVCWEHSWG